MARDDKEGLVSRFGRLSTGLKMLFWISVWLLPLGLIAILASIDSARQNNADRHDDTMTRLELKTQKLDDALSRSEIVISTASTSITLSSEVSGVCESTLPSSK